MDFVHDQLATGKKIRMLTVVDTFSRLSPIIDPQFSYRAADVVRALDHTCVAVVYPKAIRVAQVSEFVSRDLDLWAYTNNVTLDFSRPRAPTDHAFSEAFNGRLRGECLNARSSCVRTDGAQGSRHDACRRGGKVGGLAQLLQHGSAARGDRQQTADLIAKSRQFNQHAGVTMPGKSTLRWSRAWTRSN